MSLHVRRCPRTRGLACSALIVAVLCGCHAHSTGVLPSARLGGSSRALVPKETRIRLPNRSFEPVPGQVELPPDLFPAGTGAVPILIQFSQLLSTKERELARTSGAELREYVNSGAYVVMLSPETEIMALPHFRWAGEFRPEDRMAPALWAALNEDCGEDLCLHRVVVSIRDATLGPEGESLVAEHGRSYRRHGPAGVWALHIESKCVVKLASKPSASWLELLPDDGFPISWPAVGRDAGSKQQRAKPIARTANATGPRDCEATPVR